MCPKMCPETERRDFLLNNATVHRTVAPDELRPAGWLIGVSFQVPSKMKITIYPNGYMVILVRETGLEPVRVAPHAPQTCASADSATLASTVGIISNQA